MPNHSVFRHFAKDSKGSAMLTVVITMMFVVALGTALLYSAYRGLQLSVLARNDKETFYDASTAVDEIKTGIQDEVCVALEAAYTDALVAYGKNLELDIQAYFEEHFILELGTVNDSAETTGIFDTKKAEDSYTVTFPVGGADNLKKYISAMSRDKVSLPDSCNVDWESQSATLTVKGFCVNYISEGYESKISTDIVIEVPDFFTGSAVSSGISQYTIVANNGITSPTTGNTITGGVYAGINNNGIGINVPSSGSLTITGGKVVSAGTICVADDLSGESDTTLTITPSTFDIWAKEINVGKNSKATLNGNTYVADDLVIGGGSTVTLKGRYSGFGSDDASTAQHNDKNSSSIFVNSYENGKNATLNINDLEQLNLAGVSFINVSNRTNAGASANIATGESIAAKPDQLAYLVPAEAIKNYKTNPTALKTDESGNVIAPIINTATVLWSIGGENKTLADYIGDTDMSDDNYVGSFGRVVTYYTQSTTQTPCVGYMFLSFTNQTKANQYFKDYFTAKPDSIKQYLDIYLNLDTYRPAMTEITKGNIYRNLGSEENKNWENILGSVAFPDTQAKCYELMFNSLSVSPLAEYINVDNLNDLDDTKTLKFKNGDTTVAIVSGNDYTYNTVESSDISIIIADGDVTVAQSFEGIIIAGGTVTVNAPITYIAPTNEVLTSQATVDGDTISLSDYLNENMFNGEKSTSDNEWSLEKLVYYNNWKKN